MPITLNINVHFPGVDLTLTKLAEIQRDLAVLITKGNTMNQQVQALVDAVAAQTGEIASMKTFVSGLEQAVADALAGVTLPADVQAAIDGVFASVTANTQAIKDAIDSDPATPAA